MEGLVQVFVLALSVAVCFGADNSLKFIIIGDNGGSSKAPFTTPIQLATAHGMAQVADKVGGIDFVLELGDNFYEYGIRKVDSPRFQTSFENIYTNKSLQVPWYLIAGNHDHIGNVSAQIDYSRFSNKWTFKDFYYPLSFKIPNSTASLDILMIDTVKLAGPVDDEVMPQPEGPDDPLDAITQWGWIEEHLKSSQATYLFAAGHYPIYSIAEHGPTHILEDILRPMLYKHKANGYFSGHDHNLQYLQESNDNHTLDFFLSGCANKMSSSQKHKDKVPAGVSKFHWADHNVLGGFVYSEVTADKMVSQYINANGDVLFTAVTKPRNQQ